MAPNSTRIGVRRSWTTSWRHGYSSKLPSLGMFVVKAARKAASVGANPACARSRERPALSRPISRRLIPLPMVCDTCPTVEYTSAGGCVTNPGGITPTTVYGAPSRVAALPTIAGSAPKRLCQ